MAFPDLSKAVEGKNFLKIIAVILALVAAVWLILLGDRILLPKNAVSQSVELGEFKTQIVLSQATPDGGRQYLIIVSPQGWQETGISVKQGDTLDFDAGGRVNIDLKGLNVSLDNRAIAEARIEKALADGKLQPGFPPEHYYTDKEKQAMYPRWGWTGPNGVSDTNMRLYANPDRRRETFLPSSNYGTLIAAIRETGVQPSGSDIFVVGGILHDKSVGRDGKVYFAVNDVMNNDPAAPDLFLLDNVGLYYVNVAVRPAKAIKK